MNHKSAFEQVARSLYVGVGGFHGFIGDIQSRLRQQQSVITANHLEPKLLFNLIGLEINLLFLDLSLGDARLSLSLIEYGNAESQSRTKISERIRVIE